MGALTRLIGCITLACIILGIPMVFGIMIVLRQVCFAIFAAIGVVTEGIGLTFYLSEIGETRND